MPYIAGGMRISIPTLKDDEYALWFVQNLSFFGWMKILPQIYSGKPCGECRVLRGATHIDSAQHIKMEFDGDPHGELPLEIKLTARKLRLVAP